MGRTQISGDQVADETITSDDVQDGSIRRDDLNISEPGQALIARIIAGQRINIESTGVDAGTGDVTIHAIDTQLILIQGGISGSISGIIEYFTHHTVNMEEAPFLLPKQARLRWFLLSVNVPDPTRTYRFRLRRNSSVIHTELLGTGQSFIATSNLNLVLSPGQYDLSLRKFGFGNSTFDQVWGAAGIQIKI